MTAVPDPILAALPSDERRFLLALARRTLVAVTRGAAPAREPAETVPAALHFPRGVFVTLSGEGGLRGCIGSIHGILPLYQAVAENTVAAATRDPRFPPVTAAEEPHLDIELSVLSPLSKATDPAQVEVGVHGILLRLGMNQGLLLPQVATDHGWTREVFLDHTCRKAGLSAGAWRDPACEIYLFSAEVFGERSG